uniref:Uncharacterized protein n=1 Tax=Anguilla anguilla TaxID=7936 RepID=A0A0E9UAI7_ANGAN
MNLNDGLHNDILDDLLDDVALTPPHEASPGTGGSGDSAVRGSGLSAAGYASSIFGPPSLAGLRPSPHADHPGEPPILLLLWHTLHC